MADPQTTRAKIPGLLLIALMVLSSYALVNSHVLQRFDLLIYDYLVNWQQNKTTSDIVVVGIDDESLQRLGRWPWSRQRHALLLDRLTAAQPRVVGFDILFAEPEQPDTRADARFAEAIRRNGRTVLAVAPSNPPPGEPIAEVLPTPALAESAAGLGHVDIEIDIDGLSRSFFEFAGLGDAHWPTLALAMLNVAQPTPNTEPQPNIAGKALGWLRKNRFLVPFDAKEDRLTIIPAYKVLQDDTVLERLRDKYVLVGSTATGLGDFVATPVSLDHQRMAGVIFNAQVLNGFLNGRLAQQLDPSPLTVLIVLIAGGIALVLVSTSFPAAIIFFIASMLGILALSFVLMSAVQLWLPPAAAILPLNVGFLLWGAWSLLDEKRLNQTLASSMQHQALHHAATDLPNQYVLEEHLQSISETSQAPDEIAALIIVHIKWSGSAGGIVGRPAGDRLLSLIAGKIKRRARHDDLVIHLSGDDFAILARRLDSRQQGIGLANNILHALTDPINLDGNPIVLSPRMGLSIWPEDSADSGALLRNAFIATFRARVQQATEPCVFSNEIAREIAERSQLEHALRSAIERGEFEVYYQPQVKIETGRIVGVEALIRWHNPELGLVYPATFIPVAEHTGQIHAIGRWVLQTACHQVQQWRHEGFDSLRLAVNLSPLQFTDANLVSEVDRALSESGLEPSALELEITESALMNNLSEASAAMALLKQRGVKLAIDDFGTGYSSLSHLQHFPLDRIKIDQVFTQAMQENNDVREITLTILSMARKLQLEVIAEGVETEAQAIFLKQNGCGESQGFYFSHPLPAGKLQSLLSDGRSTRSPERRTT